jgi:anti-sigma factor RsiW
MKPAVHQYEDKLLEFAYGELPALEASAVEAHVSGCAKCTEALNEIRTVRVAVGKLPQVEAPDAGLESLFAYAEQAARRNAAGPAAAPTWWRRMMAPLAGVAALGLVAGVGFKVSQESASELAPSPAAVALQNERNAYEKDAPRAPSREAAQLAEAKPVESAEEKLAQAPGAAAPKAEPAAAPEPEQQRQALGDGLATQGKKGAAKRDQADDFDQAFDGERTRTGGYEQAYGATEAPKAKSDLGGRLEQAAKASESRRAQAEAKPAADKAEVKKQAADYSNAAQRGAYNNKPSDAPAPAPQPVVAAAPPPAPAQKPAPKGGSGFGLGVGSTAPSAGPQASKEYDFGGEVTDSVSNSGGAGTSVKKSKVAAPPPSKVALEKESRAEEPAMLDRKDASTVERSLIIAQKARGAGDFKAQVGYAQQAIDAGARGEQRAQALQMMCEGLDGLGLEGQADAYCNALLTEFPNSASAKRIANRRSAPQLAPKAPARSKAEKSPAYADDEKAAPAESAPAAMPAKH